MITKIYNQLKERYPNADVSLDLGAVNHSYIDFIFNKHYFVIGYHIVYGIGFSDITELNSYGEGHEHVFKTTNELFEKIDLLIK
jgi:hypothetical protein